VKGEDKEEGEMSVSLPPIDLAMCCMKHKPMLFHNKKNTIQPLRSSYAAAVRSYEGLARVEVRVEMVEIEAGGISPWVEGVRVWWCEGLRV
jgi:hypothetical protein